MDNYLATGLAEGFIEPSSDDPIVAEKETTEAWQHLIDTGLAWSLQGWFGRTASTLIDSGICQPFPRLEAGLCHDPDNGVYH